MSTISASTTSTTAYKVTADTTGTLVLQTGSGPTTAVTIDGSQRVGIGTSSPTTTLTLSQAAARLKATSTGDNGSWSEWASNNGVGNIFYSGMDNSTGTSFGVPYAGVMYHAGAYPLVFANNATERGRFDTSGRFLVGLNTAITSWGSAAPQQIQATASGANYPGYSAYAFSASAGSAGMLNLGHSRSATVGTMSTTQSGDILGYLIFEGVNSSNALAGGGYISVAQTGAAGATYIPGALQFYTSDASVGATQKAQIDSNGSMFIGTSTTWLSSAAYKQGGLQVGNANYAAIVGQAGGTARYGIFYDAANTYLTVTSGGTFYVYNTTNGVYLSANATSWTSNSDERLKDIIEPITNAASKVSTLRAVIGKYKSDADGTRRSFLIAQDVQAVLPEAVSESQSKDQEETYLGLQYTEVIPLLVAAIKELKAEIDTLKGAA